ncbi:MAG: hypothetical protein JST03_04875 [Bacteroidetes bacterium]|nr:hypothetical protein [Bacteroidota bacterium]
MEQLPAKSQFLLSGRVFDKSKINYVEFARVIRTGGDIALTDSMGRFAIAQKHMPFCMKKSFACKDCTGKIN